MSSFTETFGGGAVSPASPSYQQFQLSANTQYYWPAFSGGNANVVSRFMNVTALYTGLKMQMPDATLASVGYDTIVYNPGAIAFNVVSTNGQTIATINPGTAWYISLTSNNSPDGTWLTIQFGTGNSSPQASSLAGAGIAAVASQLNLNLISAPVSTSFPVTSGNLSNVFVWSGGAGTGTLPLAASVGNGFFCMVSNEGTGNLTMACTVPDTIDNNPTSVFAPSQSGILLSTGTAWITVGKGTQTNYVFSLNLLNVAGSANVTLTSLQSTSVIQTYTGLLTGNISVIVPNTVQLYIVNNQTTGAFNLTLQTQFGTGIQVPQSSTSILYCDGTNVLSAFSFVPSGSTFAGGSASAPGINWSGNTNTGAYQPAANQFGIALAGAVAFTFTAPASAVNYFNANTAIAGSVPTLSVLGADGNVSFNHLTKGTGAHIFSTGGGIQAEITNTNTAVNYVALTGSVTTASVAIGAAGSDTNIGMLLVPKGSGVVGVTNGIVSPLHGVTGSSSGTISILGQAAAGTYNFNLPTTAGTAGQVLASGGGAGNPMTWASASTGSVTSVAAGAGLAGGTITTTGTISLATIADNSILANISGGVAVPVAKTISQIMTLLSGTAGGLPYCSAANTWAALGIGTTGQVLTVTAGLPAWNSILVSPAFTGTPTAPTAAVGTNTTQLATAAFVQAALGATTSFTPVLNFGGANVGVTYSSQIGEYVKIGKLVIFDIGILLTSKGSSVGNVTISGLPATASSSNSGSVVAYYTGMSGITSQITGYSGGTSVNLIMSGSTDRVFVTDANFTNTTEIRVSGIYITT